MFFLGVDGGNTKTEYLLYTTEGKFVDMHRTGTCSHEQFNGSFDSMEKVMRKQLSEIFTRNGITAADIAAAGFGLAGADLPYQIEEMKRRVEAIGFTRYGLANDGILGIKATATGGVGICAVNGTGTVVVGINESGNILQVGGVGPLSGDSGGGSYIRDRVIASLYNFYFRCEPDSVMFPPVMKLLGVRIENLLSLLSDYTTLSRYMTDITKICAQAAVDGDDVAKKILDDIGISIGKSAAGCIRKLVFAETDEIDIVQVGSIWFKVLYEGMNAAFLRTTQELSGRHCRPIKLDASSAFGGVLWAKEIADGVAPSAATRESFLEELKKLG